MVPACSMLFIIALDAFYQIIIAGTAVRGVRMRAKDVERDLRVYRYADDTVLNMADSASAAAAIAELAQFSNASRLRAEVSKSISVPSNSSGADATQTIDMESEPHTGGSTATNTRAHMGTVAKVYVLMSRTTCM